MAMSAVRSAARTASASSRSVVRISGLNPSACTYQRRRPANDVTPVTIGRAGNSPFLANTFSMVAPVAPSFQFWPVRAIDVTGWILPRDLAQGRADGVELGHSLHYLSYCWELFDRVSRGPTAGCAE